MAYRQAATFVPQYVDANGAPLNSGTISAFLAGTTTATPMYSDIDGTAAGSIITLNARGMPEVSGNTIMIWLDMAIDYKFVLKDANGVVIWTIDDIRVQLDDAHYGGLLSSANATAEAAVSATPARVIQGWTANNPSENIVPAHASGTLTVPAGGDGTYRVEANIGFLGTASKSYVFYLIPNAGLAFAANGVVTGAAGAAPATAIAGTVELVAGDTISVYVSSSDGGTAMTMLYGDLFMQRIGA